MHLVADNFSNQIHTRVKLWLAVSPRYYVHYTATYASWINQIEIWFNLITLKAIRRGAYKSVKELVSKIDQFLDQYNSNTRPFVWTDTAESILDKIKKICQYISET